MSSITLWGAVYDTDHVDLPKTGGGTARFSEGGGTGQTVTGTVTGNGTNVLEIPCNFAPDLIYIYGDMSDDVANRGVVSFTIIKDEAIYLGYDSSTSSAQENTGSMHGIIGYNESDTSNPHATYSNGVLTIDTVSNSTSGKWRSGQVYNYELSTVGTGGGTPSATQHTIYFEFEDNTNTTITGYWDGTFISDAIRATTPRTYNNKTVTLAQLDGTTWYSYNPSAIPLNTQLIDYSKCVANKAIEQDGSVIEQEWYYASDYTMVQSDMTFSYIAGTWTYIAFYDSSKTFISFISVYNDGTVDPDDGNLATGTLTPAKIPSNAKYVRMASVGDDDENLSLIRTA